MSGLELLRWAKTSSHDRPPPIGQLLDMEMVDVEHGEVSFSIATQPVFANPLGTVHGGIAATMLDSAMGCAVHSTLNPGDCYTALELKVNFVRAASVEGEKLTAVGNTIHVGSSTATAEGKILDAQGHLVAHGSTTCLIRRAQS